MNIMGKVKVYVQHAGKVVGDSGRFKRMMAITLNPRSRNREGLIRCITSSEGEVGVKGSVDRSILHKVHGDTLERFAIGDELIIRGGNELVQQLGGDMWDFIGFEDPDIWIDDSTGKMHLYFTIALISRNRSKEHSLISLGHAEGNDLNSLVMTAPVITADKHEYSNHKAKEVSIAPINRKGLRFNLVESGDRRKDPFYETSKYAEDTSFSTVRIAVAEDIGKPWKLGDTVFHPADHKIPWIAEHASPGPLLPRSFIDVGKDRLLGIMNGREASAFDASGKPVSYRRFSIGLFIYDYEKGKIEWVSPESFIQDSEAKTITFASQFVETGAGEGILYAHVDDSFVRAYTLYAEGIRALLP
ncbi:hypothetical protein A2118_01425 [Candidatus Kaiserbacteria bacterium GWA2_50_9]|uniref:Uncharacterized protein n=1 Tax=Candidatus Kaiserbacteria bacterium GWA2_50_9 TaxID=1798474 RepID=A0A1F6BVW4_9BACT|nr:MAG: hypothetical protein A2118_01425 [Candidatus Kaiserbacteria bacterium GWA2_50_9]